MLSVLELDPIRALVWSAAVNGVISAPIMVAMMCIDQSPRLMGELTVSGWPRALGWATTAVMRLAVAAVAVAVMLATL